MRQVRMGWVRMGWAVALMVAVPLAGCRRKELRAVDAAVEQARQQAQATGVAQQVTYTDPGGTFTTEVVQPNGHTRITTNRNNQSTLAAESNPVAGPVVSPELRPDRSQATAPVITPVPQLTEK